MIGQTILHYRIVEKLGIGSMAVVYKAEDMLRSRFVALKLLSKEVTQDPEAVFHFQREALAVSALRHPHICTIHEIFEFEEHCFVAMEPSAQNPGQRIDERYGDFSTVPVRSFVKEACVQGQVRFTGSALSSTERQIGHD